MDSAGGGVCLRVGIADQGVQLTEHSNGRAGTAGIHQGGEAGNITCQGQLVAQLGKGLLQVGMGLPFLITGLGILPNVIQSIQDQLAMLFDGLNILLHGKFPHLYSMALL